MGDVGTCSSTGGPPRVLTLRTDWWSSGMFHGPRCPGLVGRSHGSVGGRSPGGRGTLRVAHRFEDGVSEMSGVCGRTQDGVCGRTREGEV